MKACPRCQIDPIWSFSRNVSAARKETHFSFYGCRHAQHFAGREIVFVPQKERADFEARWDAEAERLFADYTRDNPWEEARCAAWLTRNPGKELPEAAKGWTDATRATFRKRIWPEPKPVIPPELFDPATVASVKDWNKTHPAKEEDYQKPADASQAEKILGNITKQNPASDEGHFG